MIILLSPAKALDFESPSPELAPTGPRLLEEAAELAAILKSKSIADLASLSHISEELAALNAGRWAAFAEPASTENSRPAVLAFDGDVYRGMAARQSFGAADFAEAQETLRILSGLYGVLRPLDLIRPYRLEMGTRLATNRGANLYQWWGQRITEVLRSDLAGSPGAQVAVNLASAEYFGAVDPSTLGARVISPRFEDADPRGNRRVVSFFAKRARGVMASWLIRNQVRDPEQIPDFVGAGYRYHRASSSSERPVFVRDFADRPGPSGQL